MSYFDKLVALGPRVYLDEESLQFFDVVDPSASSMGAFAMLPPELLMRVFEYMAPEDLLCVAQTCKSWQRIGSVDTLWGALTRARFATSTLLFETWKAQFVELMKGQMVLMIASIPYQIALTDDEREEKRR